MPDYKLQEHQNDAVKQFNKTKSQILFHGLGSGKSLSSIAIGEQDPSESKLVLTPASLSHNYIKELKKFNVPLDNYHLVSYEKYRLNPDFYLSKYKPKMIIADELHRAQNESSLTGDTLRYSRSKVNKMLGLSGSIAQNSPTEIASLLHTVAGKPVLGTEKEFRANFIKEHKIGPGLIGRLMGRKGGTIQEAKNLDKFKELASPYINTFSGNEDYNKHLPKVEEEIKRIGMSKEQQGYYDYAFKQAPGWVKYKINHNLPLNKRESVNLNAFSIAGRQISNSVEGYGGSTHTPKIDAIMSDIQQGMKKDKNFKAAIYSGFLESGLDPIARKLKKRNIPYGMFTGEQSKEERNQMVTDYNKGKLKTLLISPAGGEGLDLHNTKMMGIVDQSWNPQKTLQAIGRAARYDSHKSLPEEERKLKVIQYLSEPRLGMFGKIKRYFNPNIHKIGIDEYMRNRSMEKQQLNDQFTNVLKG
jgi:SNF2 family DNA or RNA helicase